MNPLYDQINLTIQAGEHHLIAFTGNDLGVVRFQEDFSLLPKDGLWKKVKAYVDGKLVDGYLDISGLKLIEGITLSKVEEDSDEIENAREINELAIQRLLISSEEKIFLASLMHLGINYEEYQRNPESIANKFFKGESDLDKLNDYYMRFSSTENPQTQKILKTLACNFILTFPVDHQLICNAMDLPEPLLNDEDIMVVIVSKNGLALDFASEALKNNIKVVLAAVNQNGLALRSASEALKDNKQIVLAAVTQDGWALGNASKALKDDKQIVLAAVKNYELAINSASNKLKNDRDVVFEVVSKKGNYIRYLPKALKDDVKIVSAAVNQDGLALMYASEALKDNKQIVLAAVTQNGLALKYASNKLQFDNTLLLASVMQLSSKTILRMDQNPVVTLMQISIDQANQLIEGYEKFKSDLYISSEEADHYIKALINNKGLKASKVRSHILSQIIKNKSITRDKEKYFLEIISHLELEAFCLKTLGLTDPKILRIILPMFKRIISYRNKEIKKDFLEIFEMYSKENLKIFLENLVVISGGKIELILPSILLSKLDVSIILKKDVFKILKNRSKLLKDKTNPLLQSLIILEKKLIDLRPALNHEKIFDLIKATFVEDLKEVIRRANLISVIAIINPLQVESISDFSSLSLLKRLINPLIESRILEDTKEVQFGFNETFIKSRIPWAIFTYAIKFIDDFKMKPIIKRFIDGVVKGTYLNDRHEHNSHKHLLNKAQQMKWENGLIDNLDSVDLKEIRFNPLLFLTTKLITDNHGGGKLERLKEVISSGSAISKPNEVESLCIELLSKDDPKDQLDILKGLQTALSIKQYKGIEFVNDVKAQIMLMENKSELKEDLVIQDTEDWQDLFFCGTEVIGSCQRIDGDPDYNKCLLGYVLDGKIRMIKIAGKDGTSIARSIIKIMKGPSGNPALLLERIYPDDKYAKEIRKFALKRAESLGIILYECDKHGLIKLESEKNTASFEYEDAGEGVTNGSFIVSVKAI